jgi:hypothetical protein
MSKFGSKILILLNLLMENCIKDQSLYLYFPPLYNGKMLGFCGNQTMKCTDTFLNNETMTMGMRITDGVQTRIMSPLMIFTNIKKNHPMYDVPYNIPKAFSL